VGVTPRWTDILSVVEWLEVRIRVSDVNVKYVNPLRTKRNLLYLKTQFVPRSKHSPFGVMKTGRFMLYRPKALSALNTYERTLYAERRIFYC
jgi:hypothetical protein